MYDQTNARIDKLFQSTLPREERLTRRASVADYIDFNPRSHERSDNKRADSVSIYNISIHAPTRGAT